VPAAETKMAKPTSTELPVLDARWLERGRLIKATIIVSAAFLLAILAVLVSPESARQNQEVFGGLSAWLGLPLLPVVLLAACGAYFPLPFAFWHLFRIVFCGAAEGGTISKFGVVKALFEVPRRHPDLRMSRLIVIVILGGYMATTLTLAYIADERASHHLGEKSQK
jgi:preprotein translocase subunit SecG